MWRQGYLRGRVLDFGCGLGVDVQFLKSKNLEAVGYDPYYFPERPQGKFDTILCLYVLNVLLPEEQAHVLMAVSELLKPEGRAYFSVRRDIRHDGFRTHLKHRVEVYQCQVKLPFRSIFCSESVEIYEYCHYNQIQNSPSGCVFCSPDAERELLTESASAYAILDKYPVSLGHALVIPKKHISNYFDLSSHSRTALWIMVERVKWLLEERYAPDGFNVGFNVGEAAGQSIPHVHIHIIPRYKGDVENPKGGIRHVIPGKGNYP
ncbi:MAG: HIT family hydrolase [Anaerolineae bacterium]|nr:MAG: HIT family hydrolase [Anaerolineae bacterium]